MHRLIHIGITLPITLIAWKYDLHSAICYIGTLFFLTGIFISSHAQEPTQEDTLRYGQRKFIDIKEQRLGIGYGISPQDGEQTYHLIDLRFLKSSQKRHYHYAYSDWYVGMDIGVNTDAFMMAPKVGVSASIFFLLGLELAYYTDFNQGTLRLIPVFGVGNHIFRLSINPHIKITNKAFEPIHAGQINLSINFLKLKSEKNEIIQSF